MKLGLLTSSFGRWVLLFKGDSEGSFKTRAGDIMLRPGPPLQDVLPIISRIGYDTVDLCTWVGHSAYPYSLNKRTMREIPRMVRDLGMAITALAAHGGSRHNFDRYGYLTRDQDELQARQDYMRACIDLAAEWKVPVVEDVVGCAPRGMDDTEAWNRAVEAISQLAEYAVSRKVKLGVEPYVGLVHSPDDFLRLRKAVGADRLGCVIDPSNFVTTGFPDMVENMQKLGSCTVHTHLKGVREKGITTPGGPDDIFDIAQFARLLDQHGYTGAIAIEEYPDSYPSPLAPEEAAQITYENVSRVLGGLGLRKEPKRPRTGDKKKHRK